MCKPLCVTLLYILDILSTVDGKQSDIGTLGTAKGVTSMILCIHAIETERIITH